MEIRCGDKVNYFFPNPEKGKESFITGTIETISDAYVFFKSDKDVKMKISFKNFHLIKLFESTGLKLGV